MTLFSGLLGLLEEVATEESVRGWVPVSLQREDMEAWADKGTPLWETQRAPRVILPLMSW